MKTYNIALPNDYTVKTRVVKLYSSEVISIGFSTAPRSRRHPHLGHQFVVAVFIVMGHSLR